MNKKTLIILITFLILAFENCKDEPLCNDPTNLKCANYAPCFVKKPVTPDFEMSEMYSFKIPKYVGDFNADLAFARGRIGFRPLNFDTSAVYTWILGSKRINEGSFIRNFVSTRQTGENNIPVTLIIEKKSDLPNYPNDDGKDTITKYIRFVENPCEYLTSGDFKVLFEGKVDSTIVGVRNWDHIGGKEHKILDSCSYGHVIFLGFDLSKNLRDTSWNRIDCFQFYSKIVLAPGNMEGTIGSAYNGFVKVNPSTLSVEAEYQIYHLNGTFSKKYKFKGRKINWRH
jgi:hypothetical protein